MWRVRQELRLKGISSELIDELLAEYEEESALENIRAVLEIQKQSRIEGQLRETLKDMLWEEGIEL